MVKLLVQMLPGDRNGTERDESKVAMTTLLPSSKVSLSLNVYEKAKRAAPRVDVYALESEWQM